MIIIRDNFSGSSGTMAGRTPDTTNTPGNTWAVQAGTWAVNGSGIAEKTVNTGVDRVIIDSADADTVLTCTVAPVTNDYTGPVVRYVTANDEVLIQLAENENTFTLFERVSSTLTQRSNANIAITAGVSYAISVTTSGSTITATLDGANTVTYASFGNTTATKLGLWAYLPGADFDNFVIDDGSVAGKAPPFMARPLRIWKKRR